MAAKQNEDFNSSPRLWSDSPSAGQITHWIDSWLNWSSFVTKYITSKIVEKQLIMFFKFKNSHTHTQTDRRASFCQLLHAELPFTFQEAVLQSQPSGSQAGSEPCRWWGPPRPSMTTSLHWDWGGCASALCTASPACPSGAWLPVPTVCCHKDSQAL